MTLTDDARLLDAARNELGAPGGPGSVGSGVERGAWWAEDWEETLELRWPQDLVVYDRMRRTDAQTQAVLRALRLPVLRTRWHLGTEGVDPRVVRVVQTELGLHLAGQGAASARRAGHRGLRFTETLRQALLALVFGHFPMEEVFAPGPATPDQADAGALPPAIAHLDRLAPRLPRSLTGIRVAPNGDLEAIIQQVQDPKAAGLPGRLREVPIPRRWLAYFVNDREAADWRGQSLLRASYKHWLIMDRLLRWGPIVTERNGMGIPVVTYDPALGATWSRAQQIAREARGGERAGVAIPPGYTFALEGVQGSTRDELPLVKYHAQQIGKNALQMVLDLGHDRGARSLGDTFQDLAADGLNVVCDDLGETMTEDVIRDIVGLTFGEDEPYPPLLHDPIDAEGVLAPQDLAGLVSQGVVLPDDDLEDDIRRRYGLPARPVVDLDPGTPIDIIPDPDALPPAPVDPDNPPPFALPPAPDAGLRARPARRANRTELGVRAQAVIDATSSPAGQ